MTTLECEIAVVGGGTAGCVVAGRLAEAGMDVLVLEAGPDYGARAGGRWPSDLLDGSALVASHDWGYVSGDLPSRPTPLAFARARVIGGCSAHNGCIAAVGCAEDYDTWATLTAEPLWGADALRPLFARVLERLRVRHYTDDEIGPFHRACIDAAVALRLPRADDLDDLDGGVGFGTEPVNVSDGVRINTAFAYLDPVRGRSNLRIVEEAVCDRVVHADRQVEVIAQRLGEELCVHATRVVLAAGAYGSAAILLRSGVGEPSHVRVHGIEVTHPLPGVGRNLHDHPTLELEFGGSAELRRQLGEFGVDRFLPEEQSLGKLRSCRAAGPFDLHVVPVAAPEHSLLGGRVLIAVAAMEPRSRGRVLLASSDPEAAPILDHGYLSDPEGHDLAVLEEGIGRARELAASAPLYALIGPEVVPGAAADLHEAIARLHGHYYHPVGTCAMGTASSPLAVCDGAGTVHGLDRITVADCSLMPVVPRANTNIPAAVVGERIAAWLLPGG